MTKRPEGLLKQPVNDRCNDGSDKREKGIGYRKKEIGPEQSDKDTVGGIFPSLDVGFLWIGTQKS